MAEFVKVGTLKVDQILHDFIARELLPETKLPEPRFWSEFEAIVSDLSPQNQKLLDRRQEFQSQISEWHRKNKAQKFNVKEYRKFLEDIGYIVPEGDQFIIETENVDEEISRIAGPQLVVPVSNARYAINAVNARWGSLYDALYGTDVISDSDGALRGAEFNPIRGQKVVDYVRNLLDEFFPLVSGSHSDATNFSFSEGELLVKLKDKTQSRLKDPRQSVGFLGAANEPDSVLLINNNLHFELKFDSQGLIGKTDAARLNDVVIEAAITTIIDLEDSIAAVDAEDKVGAYRNWLGLIKGDLTATFLKNGKQLKRKLSGDRQYKTPDGEIFKIPGRSLMLIRNVGHLMTTPAILDGNGNEVFEGILDAVIGSLIARLDLDRSGILRNSRTDSIYIVKPKMHGPEEVGFADRLFARVEDMVGLNRHTLKIGIMDEERRTTVNLKECIRAAKNRVAFINTGFLDRTGDEIHTSMEAGAMIRKGEMKNAIWISAYENSNVDVGLECGLQGRAQIGKGMWAMPDLMAAMLEQKISHLEEGANTAWVPSPTAATLHALHYHRVNVHKRQDQLSTRVRANLDDILQIPVADRQNWSEKEVNEEIENNAQGILGYVVRWIDQGIGCSKVPDINNIGLMEDRATLRISSQHIANWIHHGICSESKVLEIMERMAIIVDEQNSDDPNYRAMAPNYDQSIAFKAACDLVFQAIRQPSGYTEPILHRRRIERKALDD